MNRTKSKHPGVHFHLLSFEGPDDYARAGGIATRVTGLAQALAAKRHDTHVWFIGDPDLRSHEQRGRIHLHRWCQWISRYHRPDTLRPISIRVIGTPNAQAAIPAARSG